MKKLIFTAISLLLLIYSTLGCKLVPHRISKFDKAEYIFIGKVTAYTEPLEFKRDHPFSEKDWRVYRGTDKYAYGLIVKVKEFINLPKIPKTHFEVIPFNLGAACETLGVEYAKLKNLYPINSEILVIAKEASEFPYVIKEGNFRLERKLGYSNVIGLNNDRENKRLTDSISIADYSELNKNFDFGKYWYLFEFETRKDFLRLQSAQTPEQKLIIINRLLQNPSFYIDFFEVLKTNLKSHSEILALYEKKLRFQNNLYIIKNEKAVYSEENIQELLSKAKEELQKTKSKSK